MVAREAGLPRAMRIREVRCESEQVNRLVLDARVDAEPGQFVMAWLPGVDERPFSLASADPVTLLVADVGPLTSRMHQLVAGDWLWCRGPFGRGFRLSPMVRGTSLLLVGGGYGVAPLAFLADRAHPAGLTVFSVVGARSAQQVLLRDEMAKSSSQLWICTEDGSAGEQGLVTDVVDRLLRGPAGHEIAVVCGCGPHGMLEALRELCCSQRVPCQLSYEAVMKCGFGLCGSCAWQGLLVCRDGPVFEWSETGNLLLDEAAA
jgi:dihydroorotate dehydrogenase electron transfer subunit